MKKVFKGSFGYSEYSMKLVCSGFLCVVSIIFSVNYMWDNNFENLTFSIRESPFLFVPFFMIAFLICYVVCAFENYSICFLDNSLIFKNYFIGMKYEYKYEDINQIKIDGDLIPLAQKYNGIYIRIEMKRGNTLMNGGFRLKNFDQDEIKMIFKTLEKIGIPYHHNSISTAK